MNISRVSSASSAAPVLVLTWHSIAVGPPPLCVAPERFAAQLDLLERAGYRALALGELVERLEAGGPLPGPACVLSFDDGYRDFADAALPILERRGLPATLFVTAAPERERLPGGTAAPLLALAELAGIAARGVEIGAHSLHHVDLTALADAALERELDECRARLEQQVGQPVQHFAYPFGRFDRRVRAAVGARFRAALTTQLAGVRPGVDRLAIPRVDAHYLGSPLFRLMLARGRPDPYLRVRRRLRRIRGSEPPGV